MRPLALWAVVVTMMVRRRPAGWAEVRPELHHQHAADRGGGEWAQISNARLHILCIVCAWVILRNPASLASHTSQAKILDMCAGDTAAIQPCLCVRMCMCGLTLQNNELATFQPLVGVLGSMTPAVLTIKTISCCNTTPTEDFFVSSCNQRPEPYVGVPPCHHATVTARQHSTPQATTCVWAHAVGA